MPVTGGKVALGSDLGAHAVSRWVLNQRADCAARGLAGQTPETPGAQTLSLWLPSRVDLRSASPTHFGDGIQPALCPSLLPSTDLDSVPLIGQVLHPVTQEVDVLENSMSLQCRHKEELDPDA